MTRRRWFHIEGSLVRFRLGQFRQQVRGPPSPVKPSLYRRTIRLLSPRTALLPKTRLLGLRLLGLRLLGLRLIGLRLPCPRPPPILTRRRPKMQIEQPDQPPMSWQQRLLRRQEHSCWCRQGRPSLWRYTP